jgi:PAS domain S-box-containing protein
LHDLQLIRIATHITSIAIERKQAEQTLRQSEAQYRQIVNTAQEGIWVLDAQAKTSYVNQRMTEMLGYTVEEMLGHSMFDFIDHADHSLAVQNFERCKQGRHEQHDFRFKCKDGSELWTIISTSRMLTEKGEFMGHLRMITDITKRKHAEEALKRTHDELERRVEERTIELAKANEELQLEISERKRAEEEVHRMLKKEKELGELKSRFISIASHEFRTPLSTILFSAGLLEKYSYKWPEPRKMEHLDRIQAAVNNMTQLLNDVLLIGKAEAAKLEFNPAPVDLEDFCRLLVEEMQLSAGSEHHINFVCQGECTSRCMDEKLLQHIFRNLLSNAIKYSPEGGEIFYELSYQSQEVIFQVRDQGIGIPLGDQQRLFESFYRAKNVGNISGTGLGLAIVKNCVDLHNGKISVISELGVGTTFILSFPLNN